MSFISCCLRSHRLAAVVLRERETKNDAAMFLCLYTVCVYVFFLADY